MIDKVVDYLHGTNNVLLAGAGGGFDVFAGLPLYWHLKGAGKNVHLFNYSFADLAAIRCEEKVTDGPLYGFAGKVDPASVPLRGGKRYAPEAYLAEYMTTRESSSGMVWATPKAGVRPLTIALEKLTARLNLDAILLVDGGVDSIMTGTEQECGTILEDTVSLAAVSQVKFRAKLLVCVGFGTELEDHLSHYRALENMAALTPARLGVSSIPYQGLQTMRRAYEYVTSQPDHATSHITPRIIKAAEGRFGLDPADPHAFYTPLMDLMWFFQADPVIARNRIIDAQFLRTNTWTDVTMLYRQKMPALVDKDSPRLPF